MEKTPKKSNSRLQLVIAVMITAALFLAELYVMINESDNVILLVGVAVLILIALYFVVDAVIDCTNEKNISDRELYDNIYRSEKASYTLLKKNLEEISKQVKMLDGAQKEDNSAEIIKSQKTIAKVAMSKANETQDRLFIELNNLEASLNDSIRGLSEKLSGFQEEIERLADHIAHINEQAILEVSKKGVEGASVQASVSEQIKEQPEPAEEVPTPAPAPIPVAEDNGGKMDQDDIAALIASMTGGVDEPVQEEPAPIPEPIPVDDNPNRMMTPEEIAALIAGANN